jgi:large subunit ribosomal protein L17
MNHRIKGRKFGRYSGHRRALFANLTSAVLKHEQVTTTLAKAKEIRSFVEKIITLGKNGSLHARRQAISFLGDAELVGKVFSILSTRYQSRNGGYTRIMKNGFRKGDAAPVAIIELVDRDVNAKGAEVKEQILAASPKPTGKKSASKGASKATKPAKATEEAKAESAENAAK